MQSRSLLDFAPPTEEFAEQVREYLRRGEGGADLLYEHRLLSQNDRNIFKKEILKAKNEEEKLRFAGYLKSLDISDYDDFLLEKAMSILKSKPKGNRPEDVGNHYELALSIARALGTDAAPLLPEIESLIASPPTRDLLFLSRLKDVRDIITGKKLRDGPVAKNGSGPLGSWYKKPSGSSSRDGRNVDSTRPVRSQAKAAPTQTSAATTASRIQWLLMIVIVAVVLGLFWLLLKPRK
jgi:hypothetical protein